MRHLENPKTMAYYLTMEGLLFEVDLVSLENRIPKQVNISATRFSQQVGINPPLFFVFSMMADGRAILWMCMECSMSCRP